VLNDRSFNDLKVVYIDSTCVDKHLIGWSGGQCSRYFNAFGSTFENNEKFCVKGHHEQKW
jgi:hypothetical protein